MRLADRVIVVTGGSSGIGRAVAERLAAEGAAVVLGARRADAGEEVAEGIRQAGGRAEFVVADITVETDVARLMSTAVTSFGRLDGAFNNAGGVPVTGPLHEIGVADWHEAIAQNLTSVYLCLRYQLPVLLERGGGAVVNNASVAGVGGIPGLAPYAAAKHGVVGLTRSAALECADAGVRVNAIVTGNVDTPLYRSLLGAPPTGDLPEPAPNPTGRAAGPAEIAGLVAFLLSDEAAFITGAALAVDGGATAGV